MDRYPLDVTAEANQNRPKVTQTQPAQKYASVTCHQLPCIQFITTRGLLPIPNCVPSPSCSRALVRCFHHARVSPPPLCETQPGPITPGIVGMMQGQWPLTTACIFVNNSPLSLHRAYNRRTGCQQLSGYMQNTEPVRQRTIITKCLPRPLRGIVCISDVPDPGAQALHCISIPHTVP